MRPHFNSVFDLQLVNSDTSFFNFVISGKVTSLPKVIKFVKKSKKSFHDFSSKQKPSAPLRNEFNSYELGQFTLYKPRSGLKKNINCSHPCYVRITWIAIKFNPYNLI